MKRAGDSARTGGHIPRLFVDTALAPGVPICVEGDKAHHLRNVLRLKSGDPVIVFDGRGGEFPGRLEEIGRDSAVIMPGERTDPGREPDRRLFLAQAVARGDRMDYAIAKAVELGVAGVQPLLTARTKVRLTGERASKKQAHWQRVAQAAAEQSGRETVPRVAVPQALAKWLAAPPSGLRLVLDPGAQAGLRRLPSFDGDVVVLVGPESGLSDKELRLANDAGFSGVRLGPRVLRTETAGVACLAAIQALWGDLG